MVYRIIATCCLTLLIPAAALAQSTVKTTEQLTKDVQDLQQKLATALENLTKLTEQVAKNAEATAKNTQDVDRITTVIQQELDKQEEVLTRIDEMMNQHQVQLTEHKAVLDAITQKDSNGRDVLQLSANMEQSEEFRDDVHKAVHQSLETYGDFSIHNRMGNFQRVVVNQKEYGLNADEILTLKVPVGTVTARLPGQPLTNWTMGAPNYSQKIEIVPDANTTTTTVYRPVSSAVATPSYTLSPLPREPFYLAPLPPIAPGPPVVEYYVWPY